MNYKKLFIFSLLKIVVGYVSGFYFYFAYLLLTDTGKGKYYYHQEGVILRPIGGLMFLIWIALFIICYIKFNKKNRILMIKSFPLLILGLIVSFIFIFS